MGKYIGAGFTINGGTTGIKQTGRFYLLDSVGNEMWDYSSNRAVVRGAFSAEGESVVIGVVDFGIHYFSSSGAIPGGGDRIISSIPLWTYTIGSGPVPVYISANGDYIIAGLGDVEYGGGVALLSKNLTSEIVDSGQNDTKNNTEPEEAADLEFVSSINLVLAGTAIGLIAIFRRK